MLNNSYWNDEDAICEIRNIARSPKLDIAYKKHALERLSERGLIMSDVLYVLKNGFIHLNPEPATRNGYNKYAMECRCPNGGSREVRVIVIPDKKACLLKIISVMWVDEKKTRAGTIIGEEYNE